jgi:insertion element IS1 protein InsB
MKYIYCQNFSIKKGKYFQIQKYQCKSCNKYFRADYCYKKYNLAEEKSIADLNKEGMGISSISRYLRIPKTTVMRKLESYAEKITKPVIYESFQSYDVDEIKIFIKKKENECWLTYAINHASGKVIDFVTGRRTIENIQPLMDKIKLLSPRKIFTDGMSTYPSLIDKAKHTIGKYFTWRIERNHLTIRDRLKRLSREILCFSKSERMLKCCMKILLWG